jgi:geranylgeranyl pyrophosphate synthase
VNLVVATVTLEYATTVMNDFAKKAIDLLSELPASLARNHLQGLVEFTINRKN